MLDFYTLLAIIFFILIVANLARMGTRGGGFFEFTGPRKNTSTLRSPNTPRIDYSRFDDASQETYERLDAKMENLRELAEEKDLAPRPVAERPGKDFADFSAAQRKVKVMNYLNSKRGDKLSLETQTGQTVSGTLKNLTGKQAMVHDDLAGRSVWVNLTEITRIVDMEG